VLNRTIRIPAITRDGLQYFRLVQGAWAITWSKDGGALRERYEYMTVKKGIGKKKAIVAIARRPGVLLYTLLEDGTRYEVRYFRGGKGAAVEALAAEALSA
jgi:hypothetical protein